MREWLLRSVVVFVASVFVCTMTPHSCAEWPGVDEAVVKKFAEEAGRSPRDPYINTAQGDMLLFFFLVAGAVGGFIIGYSSRGLFSPKRREMGD